MAQPETAREMKLLLESWFPWIGSDEPVDGADVVQRVVDLHAHLAREGRK
jgi:hypothetical protein